MSKRITDLWFWLVVRLLKLFHVKTSWWWKKIPLPTVGAKVYINDKHELILRFDREVGWMRYNTVSLIYLRDTIRHFLLTNIKPDDVFVYANDEKYPTIDVTMNKSDDGLVYMEFSQPISFIRCWPHWLWEFIGKIDLVLTKTPDELDALQKEEDSKPTEKPIEFDQIIREEDPIEGGSCETKQSPSP